MRKVSLIILTSIIASVGAIVIVLPVFAESLDVTLQIPIAGEKTITVCKPYTGSMLICTGIADYIVIVYRWLVGFTAVLAVLVVTWGGVQWLISRGESGKIQEARKVIGNAIIGLVLALGSYLLLYTINPELVQYNPIRIAPIQELELIIDPPEKLKRVATPSGTCCPSADIAEILALMDRNGVNDAAGFRTKHPDMKPKLFAAIKIVLEQCPEPGLEITSTIRSTSTGSWHEKGGAIDFAGKICGVDPEELCDSEKARTMISSIMAAGYEVGTHQGTCSTFMDTGTGPHLHIELQGSPL